MAMDPLASAADSGNANLVQELIQKEGHSQCARDLALARACCNGHLDVAKILIEGGADPNGQYETAPGTFDYGPIILASCEFVCVNGIAFLLDNGANPRGNSEDSEHIQVCSPMEMVKDSYVEDETGKQRCLQLLEKACQSRGNDS